MMSFRMSALTAVLFLGLVASVSADVLEVPATAVVLPDDGSGVSRIALQFDLSGMRSGRGRVVQSAAILWEIPSLAANRKAGFAAYRLTASWGVFGPDALSVVRALEEAPEATVELFPQDMSRSGRKMMKLLVTDLARERVDLSTADLSVIVTSREVIRRTILGELSGIRLRVRYGFLGDLAPLLDR